MSMASTITGPKDYYDGRTKQSFKDATDINKILNKHQTAGSSCSVCTCSGCVAITSSPVTGSVTGVSTSSACAASSASLSVSAWASATASIV